MSNDKMRKALEAAVKESQRLVSVGDEVTAHDILFFEEMCTHLIGEHGKEMLSALSAQASAEPVAYLDIGAGGYIDIGSDLSDDVLMKLPKGRHMLTIVGTYGIDGYVPVEPPRAASPVVPDVDWLAQVIRTVDGGHNLGAGVLAEKIIEALLATSAPSEVCYEIPHEGQPVDMATSKAFPSEPKRVELTPDDIDEIWLKHNPLTADHQDFARAVIAAHDKANGVTK